MNRLKSVYLVMLFCLVAVFSKAATFNFNTLYKGSVTTYDLNTQTISGLISVSGSGFQFYQAGAQFSGNSVSGVLTYYDLNNNQVTIYGTINRRAKTQSASDGFYLVVYTNSSYTTATGEAYWLVVPGRESLYTAGANVPTSSDPIDNALNAVLSSSPAISTTGTFSNFSGCVGTASASQSITVSASNLSANLTVTAPSGFEVSWTSTSGYSNSINVAPNNSGSVSSQSVYVRLTGASTGNFSGNISFTSTNAATKTISVSGTVNALTSIGTNPVNSTISETANTTFSVTASGVGLTYQWQVSTNSGTSFSNISNGGIYGGATTSTLTLSGVSAAYNNYQYKCVVTGTCASATSTAATLTVVAAGTPVITKSGSLTPVVVCQGNVSSEQSFTVGGANLSANIVVTAPTGYEITTTS